MLLSGIQIGDQRSVGYWTFGFPPRPARIRRDAAGKAEARRNSAYIYFGKNHGYVDLKPTSSFRLRLLMWPVFATTIMVIVIYFVIPSSVLLSIMVGALYIS